MLGWDCPFQGLHRRHPVGVVGALAGRVIAAVQAPWRRPLGKPLPLPAALVGLNLGSPDLGWSLSFPVRFLGWGPSSRPKRRTSARGSAAEAGRGLRGGEGGSARPAPPAAPPPRPGPRSRLRGHFRNTNNFRKKVAKPPEGL